MRSVRIDSIESTVPFPKLMIHTVTGSIILMKESYTGTLLHRGKSPSQLGHIGHYSPELVTDFNGKVTLSNEYFNENQDE